MGKNSSKGVTFLPIPTLREKIKSNNKKIQP